MPKRSVTGYNPKGLQFDVRIYSEEDIERIIAAAGGLPDGNVDYERQTKDGSKFVTVSLPRREALAKRLEKAAQCWDLQAQFHIKPTGKQWADEFVKIEKAANTLLASMHLSSQPSADVLLEPMPTALRQGGLQAFAAEEAERLGGFPEYTGEGLLEEAVAAVYRLRDWARTAKERYNRKNPTPRTDRNEGDKALDTLVGSLAGIWVDVFERSIGTSSDGHTGQAGGPMVRYISECLRPLMAENVPSSEAIRARIRRLFPPVKLNHKKN